METFLRDDDCTDQLGSCPSDETLAAWFDGRLSESDAEELEAHVAGCDRCAEIAAAVAPVLGNDTAGVVDMSTHPDAPSQSVGYADVAALVGRDPQRPSAAGRRAIGAPALPGWRALVALAASVTVLLGAGAVWQMRRSDPARDVATLAALQGDRRPTYGRLSDFPWAEAPVTYRSGTAGGDASSADLLQAAADIERDYRGTDNPEEAHARGVALLVAGDVDAAIETLAAAAAARPSDATILNDASVAYLQRASVRSDAAALAEARRLAAAATALQPDDGAGWFNLLRVAQLQDDPALEQQAADALARLEPASSPWRAEAPRP